jgi:hypothetical protein
LVLNKTYKEKINKMNKEKKLLLKSLLKEYKEEKKTLLK